MRGWLTPTSDALERGGDGAAAAEAQRREAEAALPTAELVEQGRDDSRSRGTDRMTEGDRAAVDVDLVPVEAELAPVRDGLGGEGLVDLDQVEVADRHVQLLEQLADALDRREEEPLRRDLGLGIADQA